MIRRIFFLCLNSSIIILRAHRRLLLTVSGTFAVVSAFWEVERGLLLESSWRSSRLSLNRLKQFRYHWNPGYDRQYCTISLFYKLEIFSSCFARLETKLNIRYLFHHCKLSQRSAKVRCLKHDRAWTTREKWLALYRERDGRVILYGLIEICSYMLLSERNGLSPGIYLTNVAWNQP
jgi:hypothetical protein